MKKIGLALILTAFLFPVGWGRAVDLIMPPTGKITKMAGTVKKVEVENMYLTFVADKEKKTYRVRGAISILETLKPGDHIVISIADDSIKYIRKMETGNKGKKKNVSSPKAQPVPATPPVQPQAPEKSGNPPAGTR
ncbi:MAG: hypothetical protein PHE84_02440 [bacterium]|nr:hypothetical protein [bacterium]